MYQFQIRDHLLFFYPTIPLSIGKNIATFDLDGTLIRPLPGRSTFDRDPNNWQYWNSNVIPRLKTLISENYTIIIFTNQGGYSPKTVAKEGSNNTLIKKFTNILYNLSENGINPILYAVLGRGEVAKPYRKPEPFMWYQFLKDYNIMVHTNGSYTITGFFCGDAAGRPGDHSDCDSQFARRIGLLFFLPEQLFVHTTEQQDPIIPEITEDIEVQDPIGCINNGPQELVLLVGYPGSGKTTYANQHLGATHQIIAQDVVPSDKSKNRVSRKIKEVIREVLSVLDQGKSVVVDRTNMTKETRQPFLELAISKSIPVRIMVFDTDLETSYVRNVARAETNKQIPKVPKIVYYKMRKSYQPPDSSESLHIKVISGQ